jgi:hypothetical protein
MMVGLICVVLLASFAQFVSYCRSALASASEAELSDHVLDVVGTESDRIGAGDFNRFLQLVRLCPEHNSKRSQIRAVAAYYDLLGMLEGCHTVAPTVSLWAETQRQQCSRFAAVVLDQSISSSRNLFIQPADERL